MGGSIAAARASFTTPGSALGLRPRRALSSAKAGRLIGVQQYAFRSASCCEALDKIAALGVQHLEACFFLGLDKAGPTTRRS